MFGIGYLMHPDMKRFDIQDATLWAPPRPDAWVSGENVHEKKHAPVVPAFGDFFASYFGGRQFNCANDNCTRALEGLKKCWENHATKNPVESC